MIAPVHINTPSPSGPLPVADDVAAAYRASGEQLSELYLKLQQDPNSCETLRHASLDAKSDFRKTVLSLPRPNLPSIGRQTAIASLAAGLMCGALDGLILFGASEVPPDLQQGPRDPLGRHLTDVVNGQRDYLVENAAALKDKSPDVLQAMISQGKILGSVRVSDVERVSRDVRTTRENWQTAQLGTFQVGYAVGAAMAVSICEDQHRF